jgi:hypothetical protein
MQPETAMDIVELKNMILSKALKAPYKLCFIIYFLTCIILKLIYYESISAATKENARLLVLKIAKAIPVSQNPVLSFIVAALNSHDNKLINNAGLVRFLKKLKNFNFSNKYPSFKSWNYIYELIKVQLFFSYEILKTHNIYSVFLFLWKIISSR